MLAFGDIQDCSKNTFVFSRFYKWKRRLGSRWGEWVDVDGSCMGGGG